jgi:hypothetical protein
MTPSPDNGRGPRLGALTEADAIRAPREHYAEAVIEARLGRRARDVLEATVVLEAWTGRPAQSAMSSAQHLVGVDGPPERATGELDAADDSLQHSVIAEGVTLVLLILSVAAWAGPIRRALGPDILADAIRVALPIAVALQWGLRSRYLSRPDGLACLARDRIGVCMVALLAVAPLFFVPLWGPMAAMLIAVWVGGSVVTIRGWGPIYATVLVVGTVAMGRGLDPYAVLGALVGITLAMCVAAVRTSRRPNAGRAGTMRRALPAALIGCFIGLLLVMDPTLGWGVHGLHPAIALLPSTIGSFWGGYYLWNFYEAIPRGMRGVSLGGASRAAFSDPAMSIFVGAIVRLVLATLVLSAVVIALGRWTEGTDSPSVFVAFGLVGLVCLLIGLLEALTLQRAALVSAAVALAVELAWHNAVKSSSPGAALAIGAAAGVVVSLPLLLARLMRSGRVLATTLWIQ